jgi:hypothetical protein
MKVGCKLFPLVIYRKFSTKMKTIALCPPSQHSVSHSVSHHLKGCEIENI